jgi:hypothetical protein
LRPNEDEADAAGAQLLDIARAAVGREVEDGASPPKAPIEPPRVGQDYASRKVSIHRAYVLLAEERLKSLKVQ